MVALPVAGILTRTYLILIRSVQALENSLLLYTSMSPHGPDTLAAHVYEDPVEMTMEFLNKVNPIEDMEKKVPLY